MLHSGLFAETTNRYDLISYQKSFDFWRDPIFYRMSARRMQVILVRTLKNLLELTKGISKSKRNFWWIETILDDASLGKIRRSKLVSIY